MTRSEFIAETAAKILGSDESLPSKTCIEEAVQLANALEAAGVAPWQDKEETK